MQSQETGIGMKRVRAPNFSHEEMMHLCTLVEKYHSIIENRKTDGATLREKQKAWQDLADEYNSTTRGYVRTTDNLKSCYQNQKNKIKKMHSGTKMLIPVPGSAIPEQVVSAVQTHGTDSWHEVAMEVGASQEECQMTFKKLKSLAKKEDLSFKKAIMCTGGGTPPKPPNSDILNTVKSLMGSEVEGLYTVYDGDADFMSEQQALLPPEERADPLEDTPVTDAEIPGCSSSQYKTEFNRSDLKKKRDPALNVNKVLFSEDKVVHAATPNSSTRRRPEMKISLTEKFISLAQNKNMLVTVHQEIAAVQLETEKQKNLLQQLQVEEYKLKMEHNKIVRDYEIEELKSRIEHEKKIQKYEEEKRNIK